MKTTGLIILISLLGGNSLKLITWTGNTAGLWNVAENWSSVRVPSGGDDLALSADVLVTVPDLYHAEANSIHVSSGTLQVNNTGSLMVHSGLRQTGGVVETRTGTATLAVKGDYSAGKGMLRIIQPQKDAITIEGNLTAGADYQFDFNMNSSPKSIGRIVIRGITALGGVGLNLRNFVHNDLGVILLIQNTSANEVEGSFNIPWGTVYDLGAEHLYELKLLDWDGDGVANDVALAEVPEPARAVPCRYGLYGHNSNKHPAKDELIALAFYNIRQGGLSSVSEKIFIKSINPDFKTAQYVLSCAPNAGQTAGYLEKTDPDSIAKAMAGTLPASISAADASFEITRSWPNFSFLASTAGDNIYYNADENAQEVNSVSNFVTWIKIGNEVMKVTNWDEKSQLITVIRGIWGSGTSSHAAGSMVFSPMYVHDAYPGSQEGNQYLQYMFDPGSREFAVRWLVEGGVPLMMGSLSAAVTAGNDGIWMDVSEPGWWFAVSVDGSGNGSRMWNSSANETYTTESFTIARNELFHAIQNEWHSRTGSWPYLIGNSINKKWYWPEDGNQKTYLLPTDEKPRPLDAMCNECFVGSIDNAAVTFHDPEFWRDNIRMLMDAAQAGLPICPMIVNAGTKGRTVSDMEDAARERLELYGFASYLLGWEPDSPGANLGVDMLRRNADGRKVIWVNPVFRLDIGDPVLTYDPDGIDNYKVAGHFTYRRPYSKGVVLVNPFPDEDIDVPLDGVYTDPFTNTQYTSVCMPANTGRILMAIP